MSTALEAPIEADPRTNIADDPPAPRSKPRRHGTFSNLFGGLVLVGAITSFVALAARWHWRFELVTHFPLQIAIACGLGALVLAATRRWWLTALALLTFGWNVTLVAPAFSPTAAGPSLPDGEPLRCVSANLNRSTTDLDPFRAYLAEEQPAVVVILELNDDWLPVLREMRADYPHQHLIPRQDGFGIGMLSRLPYEDIRTEWLTSARLPTIVATLQQDGHRVTVVGTHPPPPMGATLARTRNEQLVELAELVESRPGPVVLVGDLNITPWSPYFRDLLASCRLRDARNGIGLCPTWPSLPWPTRIPIDHALVSPDVEVVNLRVGPHIGSDHRPITLDIRLP